MNAPLKYIVAVDGGGSKVSAAAISTADALTRWPIELGDCPHTTRIEGTGSAAEASWSQASRHLLTAVESVCDKIECEIGELGLLLLALTGAGRPADRNRVRQWATTHPSLASAFDIQVVGDIDPIVEFQETPEKRQPSIAVVVGTGSIVASRTPGESLVRAGGWGPILGDEASGWAIARDSLRAVCSWLDTAPVGSAPNELVRLVVQHLQAGEQELGNILQHRDALSQSILNLAGDRKQAAKLASGVLQLALSDEHSPAAQIVNGQTESLVQQIKAVHQRCNLDSRPWSLLQSGGLLTNHPNFQTRILSACGRQGLYPRQVRQVNPLVAALQMATRLIRKKYN